MSYTLASLGQPPGVSPGPGMVGSGHWAMPAGSSAIMTPAYVTGPEYATRYRGHGLTVPGSYAFGDAPEATSGDGLERPLLLLLLFAAYMNLLIQLLRPEKHEVART